jgi:hypothetical protein
MPKNVKISYNGGDSGSEKCKLSYGGAYDGVWRSPPSTGVWNQAVGFVLVPLAVAMKNFITFDSLYKETEKKWYFQFDLQK